MKRIFKDKRGVAIESALVFMAVIFFFGILLTSIVSYAHIVNRSNNKLQADRLALDQIGEDFLATTGAFTVPEGYQDTDNNNENNILALSKAGSDKVILYIEKDESGNATVWRYSEKPTQIENE